jgi:hypothetical protein
VKGSSSLDHDPGAVPRAERRPILLRAYAEPLEEEEREARVRKPPEFVLVFDTETFPDETQRLRFGTYQVFEKGTLQEKGLFYSDVTAAELTVLEAEASKRGCELHRVHEFVHRRFLRVAFKAGGLVVGFNLPFDLSRLAIAVSDARTARAPRTKEQIAAGMPKKRADRFMVGGFSFTLSPYPDQPHLRIKHQNSRAAFFRFAQPAVQEAAGSQRKKKIRPQPERGRFLDVRTLAAALTSTGHTLGSLAKALGVSHKGDFKEFGRAIDAEFVDYALNDTEVTRLCYEELARRYVQHQLRQTPPERIYSEASLGKAYLTEMGIKPWRKAQRDFDPDMLGAIMSSYFGGRAEVHIRRKIVPALYCDFASMYPSVCTLMGLWRFVIAQGIDEEDATEQTQAFLDEVQLGDMQRPERWKDLTALVQVIPDADILPVRARYAAKLAQAPKSGDMPTIGLNYLSSDRVLWFTLADCVASKLLTGKAPKVVRAVRFSPKPPQANLKSIPIAGNEEFRVDPNTDDFYRRVIELRRRVKAKLEDAERRDPQSRESKNLAMEQLALKILANATSYGIFVELNVEDTDADDDTFAIYSSQGKRTVQAAKREQPGRFFHPLLATLITGAARLMLALTERLAFDHGLNWAFCDTDSMAFANLSEVPFGTFQRRVLDICAWFTPLNPYQQDESAGSVSILEVQKQNYSRSSGKALEPLFCFAISAKRYALFNLDGHGEPVIRKASAHGLGHYVAPYGDEEEDRSESGTGVRHWEEDVWKAIITAALGDAPRQVDYGYRPKMGEPARSKYRASRPAVLDWFKLFNEGRPYAEQVKPFNFMLSFYALRQEDLVVSDPGRIWDPKFAELRPVAPYSRDLNEALPRIFDRNGGPRQPVPREWLRTVSNVLRDYHRQPEYKFLGGGWNEEGALRRRHIRVEFIEDIGKESDGWEEDDARAEEQDTVHSYPPGSLDRERMLELIRSVGRRELSREAKIAMRTIDAAHNNDPSVKDDQLGRLAEAAKRIRDRREKTVTEEDAVVEWLRRRHEEIGLASLSRELDKDASNLQKVISGKRRPSKALVIKWRRIVGPGG